MNPRLRIPVGGMVPHEGYLFVPRVEDDRFLQYTREGRWFTISGCRTMGKSSLVSRWRMELMAKGVRIAHVDVAGSLDAADNVGRWLEIFGDMLALELDLEETGQDLLAQDGPVRGTAGSRLSRLLTRVSESSSDRILIALDEVDWLAELPYAREIFTALHACQAEMAQKNSPLSMCFIGLRALHELGSPVLGTGSPLGHSLVMRDFRRDRAAIRAIAEALPLSESQGDAVATHILDLSGGQPYLSMILADLACQYQVTDPGALKVEVERYLDSQRSDPRDLFLHIEEFLFEHRFGAFAALSTYLDLLMGTRNPRAYEAPGARLLLLSGLVRIREGRLQVKGSLFEKYFNVEWTRRAISRLGTREFERPRTAVMIKGKRPRICVFNTGGTIGMVRRGDDVRPPEDKEEFLRNYQHIDEIAEIDFQQLFNVDSVNVSPHEWVHVAAAIYERRHWDYQGFVVAHGTDTMAYTASAVAFALGPNLSFPVVFTGSQTTADVRHGDALLNMLRACQVALQPIPEVVICFGNHVFRGCRAQKRDERFFDGFESPAYPPLADITETIVVHRQLLRPLPEEGGDIDLRAEFAAGILMVQLTPGLEPEFYLPALRERDHEGQRLCQGVIIQTLGAGNVASIAPYSYLDFINEAIRSGLPVLVTSPYPWQPGPDQYFAPAKAPLALGAISTGVMTAAAAVTKFRWALAQTRSRCETGELTSERRMEEIRTTLAQDLVGEMDQVNAATSQPQLQPAELVR